MTTIHSEPTAPGPDPVLVDEYDVDEGDLLMQVNGMLPVADFHPFVARVARRLGLRGWIRHDPAGALIRAVGTEEQLVRLVRAIRDDSPPSVSVRGMDPDLITAATPAVGDRFVALIEETPEWHDPTPTEPAPLAHVA